jgi:SAM-dependent methyltransferase
MTDTYDRIARFYDVDMARNMPFDDVGFYADRCVERPGPVLELGCGNGRILLELLRRGIDATGVDRSEGMLAELRNKASAQSLPARVARMDIRRLALRPGFTVILCPYSLITYMVADRDAEQMLDGVRRQLAPDGMFVIDAFVPRGVVAQDEFREDYRRPFGVHTLARWKRIRPLDVHTNRIDRRYQILGVDGAVIEQVDVSETLRPVSPDALRAAVVQAGMQPAREWWDYGGAADANNAQFFTLAARAC